MAIGAASDHYASSPALARQLAIGLDWPQSPFDAFAVLTLGLFSDRARRHSQAEEQSWLIYGGPGNSTTSGSERWRERMWTSGKLPKARWNRRAIVATQARQQPARSG